MRTLKLFCLYIALFIVVPAASLTAFVWYIIFKITSFNIIDVVIYLMETITEIENEIQ